VALTYTQLQTAVQDAVENTFSATDFATMTRLAEQKIFNITQLPSLRKTDTTITLAIGVDTINAPADFLYPFSLAVVLANGSWSYLLNKDVNFIRESYPNPSSTGTPAHYALVGATTAAPLVQQILVGPTPSAALTLNLNYAAYPESITTAASGTSWLGQNFESVLFNGVMVEAARWMKQEQDIMAMMDKEFQQSLALIKQLGDGKDRQDTYRSGQARVGVI
jgi:hypothetical protein